MFLEGEPSFEVFGCGFGNNKGAVDGSITVAERLVSNPLACCVVHVMWILSCFVR